MIPSEDVEQLKLVFVTKDECGASQKGMHEEIASIKIDMAAVKTKLNILIGILSAIGVAVLGVAVKLLFA